MNASRGRAYGLAVVARLAVPVSVAYLVLAVTVGFTADQAPADEPAADATVHEIGQAAFTQHLRDLTDQQLEAFALGNRVFGTTWVEAPASVEKFDGLGPYYSQRSCSGCHIRDGRGLPPSGMRGDEGLFAIRLAREVDGVLEPDPKYGEQLSERSLPGLAPEGHLEVRWQEQAFRFPDGELASLRSPEYEVRNLPLGPLAPGTQVRPRIAPAMPGVGLLEAIPDSAILAREDPDDADGDGISGRARRVPGPEGVPQVGRFGWKADEATIMDQVATALRLDIGITSDVFPKTDLTPAESLAAKRREGGKPEIDTAMLSALVDYCAMLGVPARRNISDAEVDRGGRLFVAAGCRSCHGGAYTTDGSEFVALSSQRIEPGTDLLLHDMGSGLAEAVSDSTASGAEWRTPPLWGLGLHARVSGRRFLLHDGRARTLIEAILWHGGEARSSRDRFINMPGVDRRALLDYLESL